MKPDKKFLAQPKEFWANVRSITQEVGYSSDGLVIVPRLDEIRAEYFKIGLTTAHIADKEDKLTDLGKTLMSYFEYRAEVLNKYVEPRLMNADQAAALYKQIVGSRILACPQPLNKQKGAMRRPAYLTCMVNAIICQFKSTCTCNYNPLELTTVTRSSAPVRTLSRRLDGAFPSAVNPVAVWEIKEYYYTTTFGSRIADGVYESLLDGMEIEELRDETGVDIKHYLVVDARDTWWSSGGRAYLCRIVDMLHMGYVDEVLFGREVAERLPSLVGEWVAAAKALTKTPSVGVPAVTTPPQQPSV